VRRNGVLKRGICDSLWKIGDYPSQLSKKRWGSNDEEFIWRVHLNNRCKRYLDHLGPTTDGVTFSSRRGIRKDRSSSTEESNPCIKQYH